MATVLISGVFDPLHAGHLAYIANAQTRGRVIAAVSNAPEKHPPLVPLADRVALLSKMGCEPTLLSVADAVLRHRPDLLIKGKEWRDRLPDSIQDACKRTGTQIEYCDTRYNSSSALLANYERARNAEKLAAFEQFVQQQKPADKPWEPVTDYSFEARKVVEKPHAEIIKATFPGCSVLDYGCGFGHLVKLLKGIGVDAVGYDPKMHAETERNLEYRYDLLICREVLEHVTVPTLTSIVHDMVTMAKRFIYVTTRFTAQSHLLDVDGTDDLDPTHITMLNQDLLRTLFVLEGCTRRADLESALDWQQKGRVLVYEVPRG